MPGNYVMRSLLWAFNGLMAPAAAPAPFISAMLQLGVARAIGIMINTLSGADAATSGANGLLNYLVVQSFGRLLCLVSWPMAIESKHISGQQFAQLWQKFAVVCIKCSLHPRCRWAAGQKVAGPQKMWAACCRQCAICARHMSQAHKHWAGHVASCTVCTVQWHPRQHSDTRIDTQRQWQGATMRRADDNGDEAPRRMHSEKTMKS